ncbi:hypothetical protein C1H46_002938 [Malus baccata]|uniref:Uncharacterized protein n=1 Tax=Malus baccata TaxID=106549 RepID=A0A540NK33_MALBA|nr:hypothetical protein C1H46_002938 [Malus baccata]
MLCLFPISFCKENTLNNATLIKGKIVVCAFETFTDNREGRSVVVNKGGGVGMILVDPFLEDVGFQFFIPGTLFGQEEAHELQAFMMTENSANQTCTRNGSVLIHGAKYHNPRHYHKPDITGPGVNVLAAWSLVAIAATAERSVNYITKFPAPRCLARMYLHLHQFLNYTNRPEVQQP